MPVLSCYIPAFPLALLKRANPRLVQRPLALVGNDERVLVASRPALNAGVMPGQTARQARIACPELLLQEVDLMQARNEFEALLSLLDLYSDAVEPAGLGNVYLAAPDLKVEEAVAYCQDLGRHIRREFGKALQPAIGCDRSKFTARAAARHTHTGTVRVVLGEAEVPFLRPLPVRLLPLPKEDLRLLGFLGIYTLGQYAALSPRAVFQQFGSRGRLAQEWARGHDRRPVIPRDKRPNLSGGLAFDPPVETLPGLLAAAEDVLLQLLTRLQERFQAAQLLQARLSFVFGSDYQDVWHLAAPTSALPRLLALLSERWQEQPWPAPVSALSLTLGEIQEAADEQLTLFPGAGTPVELLGEWVSQVRRRYGEGRLLQARVLHPTRLQVEQRVSWQEFTI
ncbi:MAG: hypothetical protein D6775_13015 [Caldilineae bacterium]|nr:MAG: hypothetical protein D6775_13015 [Caldilineae bacterium]